MYMVCLNCEEVVLYDEEKNECLECGNTVAMSLEQLQRLFAKFGEKTKVWKIIVNEDEGKVYMFERDSDEEIVLNIEDMDIVGGDRIYEVG